MIRELAKSVREYKKASIMTPIWVALEVVLECIIPFIMAMLVNQIKAGCTMTVIFQYGVVLVVYGAAFAFFGYDVRLQLRRKRPADWRRTSAKICFTAYRSIRLKTLTNFLFRRW